MFTMELTWGEALGVALSRNERETGYSKTETCQAVAEVTLDSRNTIAKLFRLSDVPERRQDRLRAAVLVLAVGGRLDDYGLSVDDLPRKWTVKTVRELLDEEFDRINRCSSRQELDRAA